MTDKPTDDDKMGIHDMLSIREQIIPKIVGKAQQGHVVVATRGLLVGLMCSKDKFTVSTTGTSFLHGYLVALERALATAWHIEPETTISIEDVNYEEVDCDRCMSTGKIKTGGVRSIKLQVCPKCHGKGHLLMEMK